MATYQLPPPPPLCHKGDMTENVKSFKSRWSHWILATGLSSKLKDGDGNADPNGKKLVAATLLTVIGPEGERISRTKPEFTEQVINDPDQLWAAFEKHFLPERHVLFERFKFFKCEQTETESVADFELRLRGLAATCEFAALETDLIRDILVAHTSDNTTRDKLLKERPVPNLNRCLQVLTASETSRRFTSQLTLTDAHTHATRKIHTKTTKKTSDKPFFSNCIFCGKSHYKGECPAYGKICKSCQKKNHFAEVCKSSQNRRTKKTHAVTQEDDDEESSNEDHMFSLSQIGEINKKNRKAQFMVNMKYTDEGVHSNKQTQLDTGATCSAMSYDDLIEICQSVPKLEKSTGKLRMYDGSITEPLGSYSLDVKINNTEPSCRVKFDIIKNAPWPIIDGATCKKHGWISLNVNNVHGVTNENDDIRSLTKAEIIGKYASNFDGLGCLPGEYKIEVDSDVHPIQDSPRRVPLALKNRIQDRINELEKLNIIEKVEGHSDWISSAVYVDRKNKIRVTLDPKALNKAILRPRYQMPTIEEVLPQLKEAKVFSILDAKDGFFQIKLHEESQKLTTFWGPNGTKYMYLRCPQGISSAPEEYQRRQVDALNGLAGCHVIADDIIVFGSGSTYEEALVDHDRNFMALMQRAQEVNLKFNKSKLQFRLTEVPYMGHLLTDQGVKPDPLKVEAITNMPRPNDAKGVLRLLGSVNYLSKFLPNLSAVVAPIRKLTYKDVPFHWESQQEEAFKTVLNLISDTPVLRYYNTDDEITIENDCSSTGIGCCLKQNGQPISFASKSLTPTEQNYAQIEKEMLAIVFGCERFNQYIYGRDVINVETDHKPLVSIMKKSLLAAPKRLQRMMLRLDKYNLNVGYKKGTEMFISDMLSRASLPNKRKEGDIISEHQIFQLKHEEEVFQALENTDQLEYLDLSGPSQAQIRKTTLSDPELQCLASTILLGWPETKQELPDSIRLFWPFRDELVVHNGIIYKGMRVFVPNSLRKEMIKKSHSSHLGRDRSIRRAKDVLFWPGMYTDIANAVDSCETCAEFASKQQKEPMMSHPVPELPFEIVSQDLFTLHHKNYLITVDHYSDYFLVDELKDDTTAETIIEHTKSHFAEHGIPETVITDNGPQFTSQEFQTFSRKWEFKHVTSSPMHPQSNGKAEVTVKIAKSLIKKAIRDNKDYKHSLLEWRNAPCPDGYSPSQKLFSRRTRTTMPTAKGNFRPKVIEGIPEIIKRRKQHSKEYYDKSAKAKPNLEIGDHVRLQPAQPKQPWSAGAIAAKVGPRSIVVQTENGRLYRRNTKWVKKDNSVRTTSNHTNDIPDISIRPESNDNDTSPTLVEQETIPQPPTAPTTEQEIIPPTASTTSTGTISISEPHYTTKSGRAVKTPARYRDK